MCTPLLSVTTVLAGTCPLGYLLISISGYRAVAFSHTPKDEVDVEGGAGSVSL